MSDPTFSRQFGITLLLLEVVLIILHALCTTYTEVPTVSSNAVAVEKDIVLNHYGKFQDVHVMIFIGFGFLMTFLSKYGFSSVGFNFLISAVTIQVSMLSNPFWHMMFHEGGPKFKTIEIGILELITADFAAGAVMITFGAVLGKASPLELTLVAIVEMMFYGVNENIGVMKCQAVDMGGSMFVHTFGAYFGLALSWMITSKTPENKFDTKDEGSCYHSDMFAMIGTIFLWMFWPSFNGALAAGDQQHRVIINTVIALTASCITTFVMSAIFREHNKFNMVDIQNATLAGGVAVGSASDLVIEPWAAILIGCIAGTVSVLGYTKLQPFLTEGGYLHDTCGVHNLHGMPGILGGVCGAISAASAGDTAYGADISTIWAARSATGDNRSAGEQGGYQLLALAITLAFSISGGTITGLIINGLRQMVNGPTHKFHDADYWEEVEHLDGAPTTLKLPVAADPKVEDGAEGTTVHLDIVGTDKVQALEQRMNEMQRKLDQLSGNSAGFQVGCANPRSKAANDGPDSELP